MRVRKKTPKQNAASETVADRSRESRISSLLLVPLFLLALVAIALPGHAGVRSQQAGSAIMSRILHSHARLTADSGKRTSILAARSCCPTVPGVTACTK